MKKVLCSTFGTLVMVGFLAITPPMYARGGHGGGHGGNRGGHGGHAMKHAAVGHMKGGHHGFAMRGGRGNNRAVFARGYARCAGRAHYASGGAGWGGGAWVLDVCSLWLSWYGSGCDSPVLW